MKRKLLWAGLVAGLFSLSLGKNWLTYRDKSWKFIGVKSLVDTGLTMLLALCLPPLLVAYSTIWMTHHLREGWKKTTVGVLSGTLFSYLSVKYMELLCIVGVWSMDIVTANYVKRFKQRWQQFAPKHKAVA